MGPNLASGDAWEFFARAEELELALPEILRQLEAAKLIAPSYRTLQDWRRGVHAPRFVPFAIWKSALQKIGE